MPISQKLQSALERGRPIRTKYNRPKQLDERSSRPGILSEVAQSSTLFNRPMIVLQCTGRYTRACDM